LADGPLVLRPIRRARGRETVTPGSEGRMSGSSWNFGGDPVDVTVRR
jgi:hypothetical protein